MTQNEAYLCNSNVQLHQGGEWSEVGACGSDGVGE